MTRDHRAGRDRLILAAKLLLAFGLLAIVIVLNRDPIRAVLGRPLDGRPFALGFAAYLAGLLLAFVRWSIFVRALGIPFPIRDGVRLGFIANLFNFVLPGGPVGGDVVRAAYLCRQQRSRKTEAIASVVLDRLVGLLGLFVLACGAGTVAWGSLDPQTHRLVGVAWGVVLVVTLILAVAFSPGLYRPLARRLSRRPRLARRLDELAATGAAYRERPAVVAAGLAMAVATHALNILAFYAASRALFPVAPSLAEHSLIVPLVLFTTAVPLPFGALGLSEGISAHLFHLADYSGGAVAMMAFRVLQSATALISAGVYVANARQVRILTEAAGRLVEGPVSGPVPLAVEEATVPGLPTSTPGGRARQT